MIVGIGIDLVDVARFERTIARTPRLLTRLFAPAERPLKASSLAARYAAKEALIKALGGSDGVHWTEIEITPDTEGRPWFTLTGSSADVVAARGIGTLHLSMSHDAGLAIAYVVADSERLPAEASGPAAYGRAASGPAAYGRAASGPAAPAAKASRPFPAGPSGPAPAPDGTAA
ncbi:hypothetical protein GCM10022240_15320 [Microbacterium kribbense]|uniref:Holo-[acyl-carrier-protein] synthase n=1 Tax=Microbacterium kribbense TaxID=433645 RepID=A0ABP7GI70_9MICO